MNTARSNGNSVGNTTLALAFGGTTGSNTGATEEYDGSSWTTSPGSMNTARRLFAGAGIQTSALAEKEDENGLTGAFRIIKIKDNKLESFKVDFSSNYQHLFQ